MLDIKKGTNKFYVGEDEGKPAAEVILTTDDNDRIIIEHTYVTADFLKGKGAGKELIKCVVDHAREEGKKVIPHCKFAIAEFQKNKDYEDVLDK